MKISLDVSLYLSGLDDRLPDWAHDELKDALRELRDAYGPGRVVPGQAAGGAGRCELTGLYGILYLAHWEPRKPTGLRLGG